MPIRKEKPPPLRTFTVSNCQKFKIQKENIKNTIKI